MTPHHQSDAESAESLRELLKEDQERAETINRVVTGYEMEQEAQHIISEKEQLYQYLAARKDECEERLPVWIARRSVRKPRKRPFKLSSWS